MTAREQPTQGLAFLSSASGLSPKCKDIALSKGSPCTLLRAGGLIKPSRKTAKAQRAADVHIATTTSIASRYPQCQLSRAATPCLGRKCPDCTFRRSSTTRRKLGRENCLHAKLSQKGEESRHRQDTASRIVVFGGGAHHLVLLIDLQRQDTP